MIHEPGLNKSETLMAAETEVEEPPPPMAFSPVVIPAVADGIVEFTTTEGITELYDIPPPPWIEIVKGVILHKKDDKWVTDETSTNPEDTSVSEKIEINGRAYKQIFIGRLSVAPGKKLGLEAIMVPLGSLIDKWELSKVTAGVAKPVPPNDWDNVFEVGKEQGKNYAAFTPTKKWITYPNHPPTDPADAKESFYRVTASCPENSVYFDVWVFEEKELHVKVILLKGGGIIPSDYYNPNARHNVLIGGIQYENITSNQVIAKYVEYLAKIYAQAQIKVKFNPATDIFRVKVNPNDPFFGGQFNKKFLAEVGKIKHLVLNRDVPIGGVKRDVAHWMAEYAKQKGKAKISPDDYVIFFAENICYEDPNTKQIKVIPSGFAAQTGGWRLGWVTDDLTDTTMAHEGGHAIAGLKDLKKVNNKLKDGINRNNIMWEWAGERGTKIQDTLNDKQFQAFRRGLK